MLGAQDAHVGLHVALAIEQGGVGALVRLERLDVVRQLSLKEIGGFGAGDEDRPPLVALEQARVLAQRSVLAIELDLGRDLERHRQQS